MASKKSFDEITANFNKEYGKGSITKGMSYKVYRRIPFSSPRMNWQQYGGVPRGAVTEFSGAEGSGKTTTALDVIGNAQRLFQEEWEEGGKVGKPLRIVYFDVENTLDHDWAETLGVNIDDLWITPCDEMTTEGILQMVLDYADSGEVGLIVIDSIANMVPQSAFEKDMTEKTMAWNSAPLTVFSTKIKNKIKRTGCAIIAINQIRDKFNSMFGGTDVPGGRAWKHLCSLRLGFRKGAFIDDDGKEIGMNADNPSGNVVHVAQLKTKVCKPNRRITQFTIKYDSGVDYYGDTIELATSFGYITKSGSWFALNDWKTGEVDYKVDGKPVKAQGMKKFIDKLDEVGLLDDIYDAVYDEVTRLPV